MRTTARSITAILLAAALAIIALAIVQHDAIVDWWWLRKLRSPDAATWQEAAEKLAERRSLRAVPDLLRIIRERPEERILRPVGPSHGVGPKHLVTTPAAHALYRIGPQADRLLPDQDIPVIEDEPRVFSVIFYIRRAWALGPAVEVVRVDE